MSLFAYHPIMSVSGAVNEHSRHVKRPTMCSSRWRKEPKNIYFCDHFVRVVALPKRALLCISRGVLLVEEVMIPIRYVKWGKFQTIWGDNPRCDCGNFHWYSSLSGIRWDTGGDEKKDLNWHCIHVFRLVNSNILKIRISCHQSLSSKSIKYKLIS